MNLLRNLALCSSIAVLSFTAGCPGNAKSPSDVAMDVGYQFVGAGAMTVKAFDSACAETAQRIAGIAPDGTMPLEMDPKKLDQALDLVTRCDLAEESARKGLNLAEDTLRTWSAAKVGDLGCAASRFLSAFDDFEKIGASAGFKIPEGVTHVVDIARSLVELTGVGGSCRVN